MPLKLPFKLPDFTYFQNGSADMLFEWTKPVDINYALSKQITDSRTRLDSLLANDLKSAKNQGDSTKLINNYVVYKRDDSTKIQSNFKIYKTLDKFYTGGRWGPSALIFGGMIVGDKRDNIFNPTKGYYFNLSLDITTPWVGIAKFIRPQASYYFFTSLSNNAVFAFKLRGGYTYWWDRDNSYIPIDRQFFGGGANSVRGWSSRRLRYPQPQNSDSISTINAFFQDFFGSLDIIEGSFEYRYRFSRPKNLIPFLADQIANIGFTVFLDWGNTFHWIIDDTYNYKFWDYIKGLAVGTGFGINYQTPIGPFRVDFAWPFYDPSAPTAQTIFTRFNVLKDTKFNIGLGYAF
jgi:translocation and assembly module TamA